MKIRQRGASLLIPVLIIVTAGAFAVIVAARQSGGDIFGTEAQADSTEALFLAETGIERATRRFFTGTACNALSENVTNLTTIGYPGQGRSIAIGAGANSGQDFGGVALPATRCRIQVAAQIAGSSATRTLQAIIDRSENFVGSQLVAGFDNPAGAVNPAASWTGGAYDYAGGYLAGPNTPNCLRSGYAVKARAGAGTANATSQGSAPVAFSVLRPSSVLATFDYRIVRVGNGGAAACTTNPNTGPSCVTSHPTLDATSPSGAGNGQICMTLRDTAGGTWVSTRYEALSAVDASGVYSITPAPACLPGTQRGLGTACTLYYNNSGGTGTGRGTVRFTVTAGGSGVLSLDQLTFKLYVPNPGGAGNAYEMWIDNLVLQPSTGVIAGIAAWRDCAVSACPAV